MIKQRFPGFHLQINARSYTDINPEIIRQKLGHLSGATAATINVPSSTSTSLTSQKSQPSPTIKETTSSSYTIQRPIQPFIPSKTSAKFQDTSGPPHQDSTNIQGRSVKLIDSFENRGDDDYKSLATPLSTSNESKIVSRKETFPTTTVSDVTLKIPSRQGK